MSRPLDEIQADLVAAYAARRAALSAESYSLDSGQSRQSVQRNLKNIEATIRSLSDEKLEAATELNNDGMLSLNYRRHG